MSSSPIDWGSLDPEQFQTLVSELFMGLLGWVRYQPGPLRGQDGGWDGRFEGPLPFGPTSDLPPGVWMIDAKHYGRTSTKTAYQKLKGELAVPKNPRRRDAKPREKTPIDKATSANADYLLIVTSAELRADEAASLEQLGADAGLKALRIMGRMALERLVKPRPWLLAAYFDVGPAPLVPLHRFHPRIPAPDALAFRPRPDVVEAVRAALAAPSTPQAIVLFGPGGTGKSRLLKELDGQFDREVLALQSSASGHDAVQALFRLHRGEDRGRYLVVIDDAERDFRDRVAPIAAVVVNEGLDVVLLLAARKSSVTDVVRGLDEAGVARTLKVPLPAFSAEACLELLRAAVAPLDYDEELLRDRVRQCGTNLVLLAYVAKQMRERNSGLAFAMDEPLVSQLPRQIEAEMLAALPRAAPADAVAQLIRELAALGELWPEDRDAIVQRIETAHPSVAARDVLNWLRALENEGILCALGDVVTFRSDVEAELLFRAVTLGRSSFLDELLEAFGFHERFVDHVVMLAMDAEGAQFIDVCRALLDQRRVRLATARDGRQRAGLLTRIGALARVLPWDALALVRSALADTRDAAAWEADAVLGAAASVVRYVLSAAGDESALAAVCFELVASADFAPRRPNHDPGRQALEDALNPFLYGVAVPRALFAALKTTVQTRRSLSTRERELVASLMGHLLSGSVQYARFSPERGEVGYYTRPLPGEGVWATLNAEVWDLWADGIVGHADTELRTTLLAGMARLDPGDGARAQRATERMIQVFVDLEESVAGETNFEVLAAIQAAAWWHWSHPEDHAGGAAFGEPSRRVLARVPRSLAFQLYACLWTPETAVDAEELERLALLTPDERRGDRWRRDEHWVAMHRRVAEAVLAASATPADLAAWLGRVDREAAGFDTDVPPVIVFLVQNGYAKVDALMRDAGLRDGLPDAIRRKLERVWLELAPDSFALLLARVGELRSCSSSDAALVVSAALVEAERGRGAVAFEALLGLARHRDADVRVSVMRPVLNAPALTPQQRMAFLAELLQGETHAAVLSRMETYLTRGPGADLVGADRGVLRDVLLAAAGREPNVMSAGVLELYLWIVASEGSGLAAALDALITAAGGDHVWFGPVSEEVWAGLGLNEQGLTEVLACIAGHIADESLGRDSGVELRRQLMAAFPQAADVRLDRLLAATPLDVELCVEALEVGRFSSRFAEHAGRWLTLLTRVADADDPWERVSRAFHQASMVSRWQGTYGGPTPSAFVERRATLERLAAAASAGGEAVVKAVERARSRLEHDIAEMAKKGEQERAGLRDRRSQLR